MFWYSLTLLIKSICVFILSVVYFYSQGLPLSQIFCFILCVVYFYSERLPLSKIFYSMCALYLYRKTTAIQNISFYVWSISISKDYRYPKYFILCVVYIYIERLTLSKIFYAMCGLYLYRKISALQKSSARNFGGVSQTKLHFLFLLFFSFFWTKN